MKAILQKTPTLVDSSFAIQKFLLSHFDVPWHFHPEYEPVLILKSEGKRFVGNNIKNFRPGDLVLLGSNMPHWYRNDSLYYEGHAELEAASIVVQFKPDFLGDSFFSIPETAAIKRLLQTAAMGLEIQGTVRKKAAEITEELVHMNGIERLLHFLSILNLLSHSLNMPPFRHRVLA